MYDTVVTIYGTWKNTDLCLKLDALEYLYPRMVIITEPNNEDEFLAEIHCDQRDASAIEDKVAQFA